MRRLNDKANSQKQIRFCSTSRTEGVVKNYRWVHIIRIHIVCSRVLQNTVQFCQYLRKFLIKAKRLYYFMVLWLTVYLRDPINLNIEKLSRFKSRKRIVQFFLFFGW